MKFQPSPLLLLLIGSTHVNGLCLKEALINIGNFAEDPTLDAEDGIPCSFGNVKKVLKKIMNASEDCGTQSEEFIDVFGTKRGNQIKAIIQDACDNSPAADQTPQSSFHDILDLYEYDVNHDDDLTDGEVEDRFLKEFYDGNTFMNQEVGNPTGRNVAGEIRQFQNSHAKKEVVDWPNVDINNFQNCNMNTAMCCWVTDRVANNNGDGDCAGPLPNKRGPEGSNCIDADPADNTDLCYVDHTRSPAANHVEGGFMLFPDEVEGAVHCHGFVWSDNLDDESNLYKANNLFYVSMEDHLRKRGYVRNVPGAPMCGCLEQMPTVSRADCTQTSHEYLYDFAYEEGAENPLTATIIGRKVSFAACDGDTANDLESKYEQMVKDGSVDRNDDFETRIVGEDKCEDAIEDFLGTKGFTKID